VRGIRPTIVRLVAAAASLAAIAACLPGAAAARAAADPDGCAVAPVAGSRGFHAQFQGRRRFFQLHVPAGVAAGLRMPLVIALHGAGGSGTQMERYSGFSRQADLHHFLVVYPSAAAPVWNITASPSGADDVAFVASVIADVERSQCVDRRRIYTTGVSNGAGMAALLGCDLSSELAAIAPVEGDYDAQPACRPDAPVSVLEIHGTADRIAPYYGHTGSAASQGVPPFVRGWVHRDGCSSTARSQPLASRTILFTWSGCSDVTVEHIRIEGGAHQWPGATPPDPGPPSTICAACMIWRFFAGIPVRSVSRTGGAGLPG
jgi:polyhydroxybutyrate depolymerase